MNCTNKFQKQKKVIPMAMTFRCLMLLIIFPTVFYGQTDQSLIHATYLGGSDEELGGPALDTRPGAWLFGSRTLSADMPITDGAFQQTKNSDIDGYFGIFDRDTRQLLYASYFGGSDKDYIHATEFFPDSGFVISGVTHSNDLTTTPGVHQPIYAGDGDGFIARFSESGELVWCSYFGGSGYDDLKDMRIGSDGSIYVTGITNSPGLATEGTHQTDVEYISGFLAKFTPEGDLDWSTYFGGPAGELWIYDGFGTLALSLDGETVYCVGQTYSQTGIANNAWQATYGGSGDGMIAAFHSGNGTVQWSGYFGGEGNDNLTQVKVGEDGSIYCAGITRSTTGIASPGAHQQNLGGTQNYDAMLVKFSPDGTRVWSTYYGGNKSEAQSTMVIMGDYILLNGATFSTDNIIFGNPMDPVGPDEDEMFNPSTYMTKFTQDGQIVWGTYFLSNRPIYLLRIHPFSDGTSWVSMGGIAGSFDMSDIISSDAYQSSYAGGTYDLMFFIFEDHTLSTSDWEILPLEVFPNPAMHTLTIRQPENLRGNTNLEVLDLEGRTVMSRDFPFETMELDVSSLPAGTYVLRIKTDDSVYGAKVVKY